MFKMNFYDWNCAELIHTYIGNHYDEFCNANIEKDVSELEFTENNFSDFRDWAEALGYTIVKV